ncbi:MAG: TMEM165/GDT1 family protein [Gammaproteobacteria bacterium]|nr:TMEM165/GDT1 family protein [Gammaproteobacteria bacterium]
MEAFLPVLAGAVLGLVAANAPAIWLGHRFAARLPVQGIRLVSALLFTFLGGWILLEVSGRLG